MSHLKEAKTSIKSLKCREQSFEFNLNVLHLTTACLWPISGFLMNSFISAEEERSEEEEEQVKKGDTYMSLGRAGASDAESHRKEKERGNGDERRDQRKYAKVPSKLVSPENSIHLYRHMDCNIWTFLLWPSLSCDVSVSLSSSHLYFCPVLSHL